MESSSFYITLPSNASMDVYPDNSASTYTIRMPKTLYLKDEYEVGLAEIQYPHSWHTFKHTRDFSCFVSINSQPTTEVHAPRAYYKSMHDLVDNLNEVIHRQLKTSDEDQWYIKFVYNKLTRKVRILMKQECHLELSRGLADVMGFDRAHRVYYAYREDVNVFYPQYQSDIYYGFYTLYVYCSLCESQIVGDAYVPLLRTVAVQGQDGDVMTKTYGKPHYVPVNTNKFDTIEINIKNDVGENISFETGKVICKLHFQPKWKRPHFM